MKINSKLIYEIAHHRKILEKQTQLLELFNSAFDVTNSQNLFGLLQKEMMVTEIGNTYQYFGLSLFAPTSVQFISNEMNFLFGIDENFTLNYLENLKNFLTEEIALEEKEIYFSSEILEFSFAKELIKKIFSTEKNEDIQIGLFIFNHEVIHKIRNLSKLKIGEILQNSNGTPWSDNNLDDLKFYKALSIEFVRFLNYLKHDPLNLIICRLESFVHSINHKHNSLFIFKENNKYNDIKSKKITALLTLMLTHKNKSGHYLFNKSYLTISQFSKLLSPKFKSNYFDLSIIQKWFNIDLNCNLEHEIEELLELANIFGVVFKIHVAQKRIEYGLTEIGMQIMKPYHSILTESLCVHESPLQESSPSMILTCNSYKNKGLSEKV